MLRSKIDNRPMWNRPQLQELGNLRTLVQVGNANGKSRLYMDGGANCGAESMDNMDDLGCSDQRR